MKDFKMKYWLYSLVLTGSFYLFKLGSAEAVSSVLVPPSPFKGLNGLNFDSNGQLYVSSVLEQKIYQVDTATGEYNVFINSPDGQADDLFLTPSGQIFYTAFAIADNTVYISGDIDNSIRTVKLDSKIFAIPENSSPLSLVALGIFGIIYTKYRKF